MRTPVDPQRLTRRRVEAGLSQNALARAVGVTKQLVSAVSLGKANFSPEVLDKVAQVLGCEIVDLLPPAEVRSRLQQLAGLASIGLVSVGLDDVDKVAEMLGCEITDLIPEDLATLAGILGCEATDLLRADAAKASA
ncbi:helix-turn-helix transcriptional regulator [Streptomyces cinnabarinus]|uniref:Helix-turn-helix transcriptional regulator n=1 Tax=Streptomyces cinnabarinus TaxID=67287 RepID=A0ABY7KAA1_9ACTN|nr:helix-turn-helix transcriptional regulator [Streptomyces cinnabarinus]WAZ20247.1 helix-turn-helix transcriptional regulator [Streptomyces cinnabarinus]